MSWHLEKIVSEDPNHKGESGNRTIMYKVVVDDAWSGEHKRQERGNFGRVDFRYICTRNLLSFLRKEMETLDFDV